MSNHKLFEIFFQVNIHIYLIIVAITNVVHNNFNWKPNEKILNQLFHVFLNLLTIIIDLLLISKIYMKSLNYLSSSKKHTDILKFKLYINKIL